MIAGNAMVNLMALEPEKRKKNVNAITVNLLTTLYTVFILCEREVDSLR